MLKKRVVETLNERDLFVEDSVPRPAQGPLHLPPGLTLREVERRYILSTLQNVGGNRTGAARLLGISVRCLQYKLKTYREEESRERRARLPARRGRRDEPRVVG